LWRSVKGSWCGEGSNFGLFHWLASSPLKHSRTTVRVCDSFARAQRTQRIEERIVTENQKKRKDGNKRKKQHTFHLKDGLVVEYSQLMKVHYRDPAIALSRVEEQFTSLLLPLHSPTSILTACHPLYSPSFCFANWVASISCCYSY